MSFVSQGYQQELRYNERAWAIDLISFINSNIVSRNDKIQRASGEYSLSTTNQTLFPDLLLFGNHSTGKVLQGWELKLPDTSIDDSELISNAETKARNMGLDSFVVWNVSQANLYIFDLDSSSFKLHPIPLFSCPQITSREDVKNRPDLWKQGAKEIINALNNFFITGRLIGVSPQIVFSGKGLVSQLLSCHSEVATFLKETRTKNKEIDAQIRQWWAYAKIEYPGYEEPESPLAYFIIFHWFNRFIFTNILVAYNKIPINNEIITPETTVESALIKFQEISEKTNYWAIIGPTKFDKCIPDSVWNVLKDIFKIMVDFEFSKISKDVLSEIIKSAVLSSIKKTAGLYATPENVAELLVRLAMNEKDGQTIDPFCGTGTIPEKVLQIKDEYHISGKDAVRQTWASDKFAFPIQVAALAIASPQVLDEPLKVFVHDAFTLFEGERIELRSPQNGRIKEYHLPTFSTIVSNLPFVRFEDLSILNPEVLSKINDFYKTYSIPNNQRLSGRGDLYSYVPFLIYDLLEPNGYLGVIISNSWLSTKAGKSFAHLLRKFYNIEYVVISGKGRWFHNTDVITNLLICKRNSDQDKPDDQTRMTSFVVTNVSLDEKIDVAELATDIISKNKDTGRISIFEYSLLQQKKLQQFGLSLNSCNGGLHWLFGDIDNLVPVKNFVKVYRGERRGWDPLFYPSEEGLSTIEQEFLKPILKRNRGIYKYSIHPDSLAFCCGKSIEELTIENKKGALKWIQKFKNQNNQKDVPLVQVLSRQGLHWYQMDVTHLADFVMSMNPDRHFMIQRFEKPSFANQRLICMSLKTQFSNYADFIHALLNSSLTYLQIEGGGFGRGMGVLDINSNNIKDGLHIPDPRKYTKSQRQEIIDCFQKISSRNVFPIDDEIQQLDRNELDRLILQYGGFNFSSHDIYCSLLRLFEIRKAIN